MNQIEYEKDLQKRQQNHLAGIQPNNKPWKPCAHDQCESCHGTGVKSTGGSCVHGLVCDCPKCSRY